MFHEEYRSPESVEAEEIEQIREKIDEWKGTGDFRSYLLPDEEYGGMVGRSHSLNKNAMAHIAEKRIGRKMSRYGDIVDAMLAFSQSEKPSGQFDYTQGEQFQQAKDTTIVWWRLPIGEEKDGVNLRLEEDHLKPLIKEMVPTLLRHNVHPVDLTS